MRFEMVTENGPNGPYEVNLVHGAVPVREWTQNWHDDWDNMMEVWDLEKGEFGDVMLWTTRFGSGPAIRFVEQKTPEVMKVVQAAAAKAILGRMKARAEAAANVIERGTQVEFETNGRKVQKDKQGVETKPQAGDRGEVFWVGSGFRGEARYGVKVERTGGAIFTSMRMKVLNPKPVNYEALEKAAAREAERMYPAPAAAPAGLPEGAEADYAAMTK